MDVTALEKIQAIQAKADQEIKALRQQAVSEIVRRLAQAKEQVKELEAQYSELTGKNLKGEPASTARTSTARNDVTNATQLTDLLKKAPNHRLNRKGINEAGFNLKSALNIAKSKAETFGFKQNGPQGEVWLK